MALTLALPLSPTNEFLVSSFCPSVPRDLRRFNLSTRISSNRLGNASCNIFLCSSVKIVRCPSLDRHVAKQNRIRFVQKLKTLLLSKPKHYIPIQILSKCRSYLSLDQSRSILSMIRRYPTIFELFSIPIPPLPINATNPSLSQLCVRLTPAAASLAMQELNLKSEISTKLAVKLQKLLMLSSHRRLRLSKLVHLAPDLGLPPNFRSRLCNDYPDKFQVVDTSYGRALELVSWVPELAKQIPSHEVDRDLIVDRPLKFKHLRLRKGLNLKRRHHDFLMKFREVPDVCPYNTSSEHLAKESIEAEKRACGVVRELLGLTVEKRTLIDHLSHFRKELGLPNKLRGMIVRHPEIFYVSLKGMRDSVFLVEAYDDKGVLLEKDETSVTKERLIELVQEGKRMRREQRRKAGINSDDSLDGYKNDNGDGALKDHASDLDDEYDDGFENMFDSEDSGVEYHFDEDESDEGLWGRDDGKSGGGYWSRDVSSVNSHVGERRVESW